MHGSMCTQALLIHHAIRQACCKHGLIDCCGPSLSATRPLLEDATPPQHHKGSSFDTVMNAAGRMASVQPSPRGGDGFSTPVVHNTQQPHTKTALEEMRANALAAHASTAYKPAEKPGANLTDDLLHF